MINIIYIKDKLLKSSFDAVRRLEEFWVVFRYTRTPPCDVGRRPRPEPVLCPGRRRSRRCFRAAGSWGRTAPAGSRSGCCRAGTGPTGVRRSCSLNTSAGQTVKTFGCQPPTSHRPEMTSSLEEMA